MAGDAILRAVGFPVDIARDLFACLGDPVRLCLGAADETATPMLAGRAIGSLVGLAEQLFGSEADCLAYVRMVEQWAQTQIDDLSWKGEGQQ